MTCLNHLFAIDQFSMPLTAAPLVDSFFRSGGGRLARSWRHSVRPLLDGGQGRPPHGEASIQFEDTDLEVGATKDIRSVRYSSAGRDARPTVRRASNSKIPTWRSVPLKTFGQFATQSRAGTPAPRLQ